MKEQLYTLPSNQPSQETDKPFTLPTPSAPIMTEQMVRDLQVELFNNFDNYFNVVKGLIKSGNFITGESGWQIDATGNAEFNSGLFRGTFNIGGTTITINNTESVPDNLTTIDEAGGGTLWLQNGTYVMTEDWNIPAGVLLKGVSRDGVIIDCDGTYKITIIGSDAYSTGTISINDTDITVVGSGTTFTSGMVGRSILLGGLWYEISAFTDSTHIDISVPYAGSNLSGASYTLATINSKGAIGTLSITNATAEGLKVQYALEPIIDDIYISDCGTGMNFDQVVYPKVEATANFNGVNVDFNNVYGWKVDFCDFSKSTTGAGWVILNSGNATTTDTAINDNATNGITATGMTNVGWFSVDVNRNGAKGFEGISGCDDNQFLAFNLDGNVSDNFKLTATSDRNIISSSTTKNSGAYGVNIANANCNDNILVGVIASNNSSGSLNDSGTGTLKSAAVNIIP